MLGRGMQRRGPRALLPPGSDARQDPGLPELRMEPPGRETIPLESKFFSGSYTSSALPALVLVTLRSLHFVFFLPD